MKNNKLGLLATASMLCASVYLQASQLTFTANIANNIAGVNGATLPAGGSVEIGIWDGASFSILGSGAYDNIGVVGPGDGFFSHQTPKLDTNSVAGSQLALSWSDGLNTGIIYYDINGGDSAIASQWTLKAGDGGGTDFNENIIDVADLTLNGAGSDFNTLGADAVLIGVTFAGTNAASATSFQLTAVPEPSAFALIAGCFGLAWVMVRRRA